MQLNPVAVLPRITADDLNGAFICQAGEALQSFTENCFFLLQLKLVGGVLVLAAAACPEVDARGRDADRGRGEDVYAGGAQQTRFYRMCRCANVFARQNEWSEQYLAIATREPFAPVNPFLDIDLKGGCRFLLLTFQVDPLR